MLRISILSFLIITWLFDIAISRANTYKNKEFGIEMSIPDDVLLCSSPNDEHDHGPLILLETTDSKCCDLDNENDCGVDRGQTRYISIFSSYNVIEAMKTPQKYLEWECANFEKDPCVPDPYGLRIDKFPSSAIKIQHADGWVDIRFVTQAGKPAQDVDPSVPSFNYSFALHTKEEFLQNDLCIFRHILKIIRIAPNLNQ